MIITDELRSWAEGDALRAGMSLCTARDQALAIADHIDAEYQKAIRELNNLADASLLLPVDADGVPICVGDVMEWIDLDGEVTVTCSVDAVGVDCFFAWDKGNRRYAQKCANAYRHHHVPTVEDVLREFADGIKDQNADFAELAIAEYAKRLKLAEGENA